MIDKKYLIPAIKIISELYMCRRAGVFGFETMKEVKDSFKKDDLYKDINISELPKDLGEDNKSGFDDIFWLRAQYSNETIDEIVNIPIQFENDRIWKSRFVYEEFVKLMNHHFLRKYKLSQKLTKTEKKMLRDIQRRLISEITCDSNHKMNKNDAFRRHNVKSYDEIVYENKITRSKETQEREEKWAKEKPLVKEFEESYFAMLSDHPAWREIRLRSVYKHHREMTFEEQDDYMRRSMHDITDKEIESLRNGEIC